jgi:dTDP-4-amino-4,6-dideoxygalactose transaminase
MGDAAAFSFCQDKIMTTGGEGGMLTTNSEPVWDRAWSYKDHGKKYDAVYNQQHPPGFRWLHESFGSNYRLTEMQSAIGRVQLRKLTRWVETRRKHAATLYARLASLPALRIPAPGPEFRHSYYKFYAFVRPEKLRKGWDRDRIMNAIVSESIPCSVGSCSEIYLEHAFQTYYPQARLPVARELGVTSLMFLVHPTLLDAEIEQTGDTVLKVMREASLP